MQIHPKDADEKGLLDGQLVLVSNQTGSLKVCAEVTENISQGVVSLPHGWGHSEPRTKMSIAKEHAGINFNRLAPASFIDSASGNAVLNGIPVKLEPCDERV